MKQLLILAFIVFITSCTSTKICTYHKKYLVTNIDTTKEYKLKGAYCVASIKDTLLGEIDNNSIIEISVFDRINGKQIDEGVIYFYGRDTTTMIFNKTAKQKIIKAGDYIIEAWSNKYVGTKTKRITIKKNKKIEINFYLGATMFF